MSSDFPRGRGDGDKAQSNFPRGDSTRNKSEPASETELRTTPKRKRTTPHGGQPDDAHVQAPAPAPATDVKVKKLKTKGFASLIEAAEPSVVEPWRFKNLKAGSTHFLGIVREIHDLELVVSLPNNLTGFVPITEISDQVSKAVERATGGGKKAANGGDEDDDMNNDDDESSSDSGSEEGDKDEVTLPSLEDMFRVGQPLQCVVTEVEAGKEGSESLSKSRRRIELSIKPSKINAGLNAKSIFEGMLTSATVTSKEDHGYMLDLGIPKVSCFLHNDHVPLSADDSESTPLELIEGQTLVVTILTVDKSHRVVTCSGRDTTIGKMVVPEPVLGGLQLELLRPGLLVNARVKTVDETGLKLAFGGIFSGTVHYLHLPTHPQSERKKVSDRYKVDQRLRARVLGTDVTSKTVTLTLKDSLVNWNPQSALLTAAGPTARAFDGSIFKIGEILENVTVAVPDGMNGLYVVCGPAFGYVHMSRISDSHLAKIPVNKFAAGTTHKGRVVGYDLCDELLQVSFQPSVLEQPFVSHWDIQPGMLVNADLVRLVPAGAVVRLTDTITGLVPNAHLSDVRLQHPEKLFKEGQKLKLRVVSVEPKSRKVLLTNRKSLVQDALPVLNSFEAAVEGSVVQGTVTKIEKWGCLVSFYGKVKGLVPVSEMSSKFVQSPSDIVKMGQVVKCRVLSCSPQEEKLKLSLILSAAGSTTTEQPEVGMVLGGRVISKTVDSVVLQLIGGSAIATLPKAYLAEAPAQQAAIFDKLKDGAVVEPLMVLQMDRGRSRLTVTNNTLLREAASRGMVPDSYDAVKEGSLVVGYVKNLTDYSAFIGFFEDLVGYAKKQDICKGSSANPSSLLWVGRTVLARVNSTDDATRRFTLTLADVEIEDGLEEDFIASAVEKQDLADHGKWSKTGVSLESKSKKALEAFPVGSTVKGVVKEVVADGDTRIELNNGLFGRLVDKNREGRAVKVGQKVICRSLGYDAEKHVADVLLVDEAGPVVTVPASAKGATKSAIVRLVRGTNVVLELQDPKGAIAHSSTLDILPHPAPASFEVGQKVSVKILRLPGNEDSFTSKVLVKVLDTSRREAASSAKEESGVGQKRKILDAVDPAMESLDDFSVGRKTQGKIKSVKDTQLNVVLGSNLRGRIHVSEVYDDFDSIPDPTKPLSEFKAGQVVDCKVVGMLSSKNHKFLPITHRNPVSQTVIELTLRPSDLKAPGNQLTDLDRRPPTELPQINVGDILPGFVHEISDSSLWVHLSTTIHGRINAVDASNDLSVAQNLGDNFTMGQAVRCRVVHVDTGRRVLDLSLLDPLDVAEGALTVGRVVSADTVKGIVLQLPDHRYGKIALTDIADKYEEDPCKAVAVGELLRVAIVGQDQGKHQIDLSLRPSRLAPSAAKGVALKDPEIASVADLEPDQDVRGYVVNVTEKGAFVALGRHVTARLKISEISTDYVKDWQSLIHVGQLIAGKILSVDKAKGLVEFSKKARDQAAEGRGKRLGWPDLAKGMKVSGVVTKVESYGVFIRVDDSQGISGLCHISEVSTVPVKQIDKLYQPGDAVKAIIIKLDPAKKRVSFGLKSTYFEDELDSESAEDENMEGPGSDEDEEDVEPDALGSGSDEEDEFEDAAMDVDDAAEDSEDENSGEDDSDGEELDLTGNGHAGSDSEDDSMEDANDEEEADEPLEIPRGFVWDPQAANDEGASDESGSEGSDEGEDEDGEGKAEKRKSRRAKRKSRKEKEQEVARREEELLDPNRAPETADDFERLILGSPSSSYIWVKYMAFHLQHGEIDQARDVAERALKTIHFREEAEKLNVWIAYLNLENSYGTQAKLDAVFQRACQYNESKEMHLRMVEIYERSNKDQLAEELYQTMAKKFKESSKVWVAFGLFYIQRGRIEESRKVLQRAIQSLAKRKHIETIVKFAQMEFRLGEPERGRTIFESIVSTYPKRLDIWSIYVDMELGSKARPGDPERVRKLFERMTSLQLSSKRARDLFKRWLEFEKKEGGSAEVEHVKRKAQTFVENLAARS